MKKCCVIGLGYIGLPTAGLLASKGFDVVGVDINEKIIDEIAMISFPPSVEKIKVDWMISCGTFCLNFKFFKEGNSR